MYCKNCGQQIDDNADFCTHCGNRTRESNSQQVYTEKVDNPSHLAGVASCCFPIVGLILYFLWRDEKPESAKLVCYWMIGGIVAWVIFYILMFLVGFSTSGSFSTNHIGF